MRHATWLLSTLVLIGVPATSGAQERRQIGEVILEGVPEWDAALRQRMLQFLQVRSAGLLDVSDDGKHVLITTRFGESAQLHVVREAMGARRQITFFDEPVRSGQFIPGSNGQRLLFSSDVGGNENSQIYRMDLASGRFEMLTDGASRNETPTVSPSGRQMAFTSTARNGRDFDVYVRDLSNGTANRLAWETSGAFYAGEFSPDDGRLLVLNYVAANETHWHLMDVVSGEHDEITPASPPSYYGGGVWSHDGQGIFFTSDRDGEFQQLYRYDLAGGAWHALTADVAWDVDEVAVEPTGKGIAFVTNEDGLSRLHFADARGENRRTIPLPNGIVSGIGFANAGGVLGFTLTRPTAPGDAYTVTFPGGELTRWTESEVGGIDPATFIEPTLIRYPTFDQVNGKPREISAFYFLPRGAGPHPVVISTHGGPEAQYRPNFSSTVQYWASEMGIAVIAPNVRGSTGYGRSFHQLDNGVLRENAVKDVGALLDWIAKQPELDKSRVGIFGGSYGGYMVLGSLMNFPERIKAGVDYVGIADFVTFLENTSEYRRDLRRAEYGDERDPAVRTVLEQISPLRNAERIRSTLFVIHGANDPRVPLSEAQQIVAKMREMNRQVWFVNALNEGHGFAKKANSDLAAILFAHFWQQHLIP